MISWALPLLWACGSPELAEAPRPVPEPAAERRDLRPRAGTVVKPAERDEAYAGARCNDGTPFAYTIRPGVGDAADTWVINLTGGFFCDDAAVPCSGRKSRLTTTLPEADGAQRRLRTTGIFSTDAAVNPDFADATHVDAHYCSSDLWLGDTEERRPTTGDPEQGWYFSGRENVRVLFASLQQEHGLDDATDEVLLLGTSAGGAGLAGNLPTVVEALPTAVADGRVKAVLDGSWLPEVPWSADYPDADRWGPAHPDCAAAHRTRGDDPGLCLLGPHLWPHLRDSGVPILVQLSGQDETQTPIFGVDTPEERAAWQARIRGSLASLPWVFSGGHAYHIVAVGERFDKGPEGRTFRDLLGRFWRSQPPEQIFFRYPQD